VRRREQHRRLRDPRLPWSITKCSSGHGENLVDAVCTHEYDVALPCFHIYANIIMTGEFVGVDREFFSACGACRLSACVLPHRARRLELDLYGSRP
jgi:hypothetical protein